MAPGYRLVAWLLTAAMVALGAVNVGIALCSTSGTATSSTPLQRRGKNDSP